jgi:hypothetical protein
LTQYEASESGVLDLDHAEPVSGVWRQADPMSIFWRMTPQEKSDQRFWSVNVSNGLFCKFQLFDGNLIKFIKGGTTFEHLNMNIVIISDLQYSMKHILWNLSKQLSTAELLFDIKTKSQMLKQNEKKLCLAIFKFLDLLKVIWIRMI